jgi:CRISPR-associated protein Cas1
MKPLLISGFGSFLSVDRRKLIVYNTFTKEKFEFYPHQIEYDTIIIDGHSGAVSFDAIRWIAKHDIALTLLNWNGNVLSTLQPKEPVSGKLKIAQYKSYLNKERRINIASEIIKAKINKSYEILEKLSVYYKDLKINDVKASFDKETSQTKLESINYIMMYEGRVADLYWKNMAKIFNYLAPEFNFKSRKGKSYSWNMNASDEINAMLNYGYAILETLVRKYVNAIGLDQDIGFLHELANSRASLIYDLQELYRWVIDLSVIQVLEDKKLKKSDFIVTENYNIRLRESAAKMLINKIKVNFNSTSVYKGKNRALEFTLLDNIRKLADYVSDKSNVLEFYIPEVKIDRNDDIAVRDKILSITPAERKRLKLNKSTLWYRQKAIKEGKRIKFYTRTGSG